MEHVHGNIPDHVQTRHLSNSGAAAVSHIFAREDTWLWLAIVIVVGVASTALFFAAHSYYELAKTPTDVTKFSHLSAGTVLVGDGTRESFRASGKTQAHIPSGGEAPALSVTQILLPNSAPAPPRVIATVSQANVNYSDLILSVTDVTAASFTIRAVRANGENITSPFSINWSASI